MSTTATALKISEATERPTGQVWNRDMRIAPRSRRLLLKCPWNGRYVPQVGEYRHEHGGWCALSTPVDPARQLMPEAWAEIPAFDDRADLE
jgi:hypothetical protein